MISSRSSSLESSSGSNSLTIVPMKPPAVTISSPKARLSDGCLLRFHSALLWANNE